MLLLSNMGATSHILSTWNMAGMTEELDFKFYLILKNLNTVLNTEL